MRLRFWKQRPRPTRRQHTAELPAHIPIDMRTTPTEDPLNHSRPDGSIRPGDPAWPMFEEMLKDGRPRLANQRDDGTWEVETLDP
jgi:hypothetical protein